MKAKKLGGKSSALSRLQERHDRCVANMDRMLVIFRQVVGEMLGPEAEGLLDFTKPDLEPQTRLHGEFSGNVTKSMSVIYFDFAALIMAIESRTFLPAFMMHDCPRVHDMAQTLYWKIFRFMRKLEHESGETPLFQYIVTTSSAPAKDSHDQTSVVLNLDGRLSDGGGRCSSRSFDCATCSQSGLGLALKFARIVGNSLRRDRMCAAMATKGRVATTDHRDQCLVRN